MSCNCFLRNYVRLRQENSDVLQNIPPTSSKVLVWDFLQQCWRMNTSQPLINFPSVNLWWLFELLQHFTIHSITQQVVPRLCCADLASLCLSETAFSKFYLMSLSCPTGRDMGPSPDHSWFYRTWYLSIAFHLPSPGIVLSSAALFKLPLETGSSQSPFHSRAQEQFHFIPTLPYKQSGVPETQMRRFGGNATYYHCNSLAVLPYILSSVIVPHSIALFYIILVLHIIPPANLPQRSHLNVQSQFKVNLQSEYKICKL